MEQSNFMQVIEQTDDEKLKMYMKCTKKELAEMLIQCNKILDNQLGTTIYIDDNGAI